MLTTTDVGNVTQGQITKYYPSVVRNMVRHFTNRFRDAARCIGATVGP